MKKVANIAFKINVKALNSKGNKDRKATLKRGDRNREALCIRAN